MVVFKKLLLATLIVLAFTACFALLVILVGWLAVHHPIVLGVLLGGMVVIGLIAIVYGEL